MPPKTWQIKDLLKVSSDYLKKKGIENPRLNAEVLLAHQLHVERMDLYLNFDQPLTETELSSYRSLIKRRIDHEPLQYITVYVEYLYMSSSVQSTTILEPSFTILEVSEPRIIGHVLKHIMMINNPVIRKARLSGNNFEFI